MAPMTSRAVRRYRGQQAVAATAPPALAGTGGRALFRHLDPLRFSLSLLILMTISRVNGLVPGLAVLRPLLLLSGAVFVYAVLNPRYLSGLPWNRTWAARLVAALGIVACISGIFGISLGGTGRFVLEAYSKVLVTAFLIMATIRSPQDLHRYIWVYVIACGLLVWQALFVFEMQRVGDGLYRLGEMATYDANDVGVVLLVGLALTLYTFEVSGVRGKLASAAIIVGIGPRWPRADRAARSWGSWCSGWVPFSSSIRFLSPGASWPSWAWRQGWRSPPRRATGTR
jgi:hypothetical protein